MLTPLQTARRRSSGLLKLDQPWPEAAEKEVFLRRGQLTMIAAAPGVGKSVLAMSYALQARNVNTLYLSMDTDAYTTSIRLMAATAYLSMPEAEAYRASEEEAPEYVTDALGSASGVHFAFPSSPDESEVRDRVFAYREARGSFPDLLIVDNLSNIAFEDEEFSGLRRIMSELQGVATKTGSSILVLHHVIGEYESGNQPIPLRGVNGKISKAPALVLTAHRPDDDHLTLSVCKNRFGPADPSGHNVKFTLPADLAHARIGYSDGR